MKAYTRQKVSWVVEGIALHLGFRTRLQPGFSGDVAVRFDDLGATIVRHRELSWSGLSTKHGWKLGTQGELCTSHQEDLLALLLRWAHQAPSQLLLEFLQKGSPICRNSHIRLGWRYAGCRRASPLFYFFWAMAKALEKLHKRPKAEAVLHPCIEFVGYMYICMY